MNHGTTKLWITFTATPYDIHGCYPDHGLILLHALAFQKMSHIHVLHHHLGSLLLAVLGWL